MQIIKRCLAKWINRFLFLMVTVSSSSIWADLPVPPADEMASSSKGWIDVFAIARMNRNGKWNEK